MSQYDFIKNSKVKRKNCGYLKISKEKVIRFKYFIRADDEGKSINSFMRIYYLCGNDNYYLIHYFNQPSTKTSKFFNELVKEKDSVNQK